jgi:hypothetical protein
MILIIFVWLPEGGEEVSRVDGASFPSLVTFTYFDTVIWQAGLNITLLCMPTALLDYPS